MRISLGGTLIFEEEINSTSYKRIIFALTQSGTTLVLPDNLSLRSIDEHLQNCRILEVYGSNETGVFCVLNDCLAGPQTPEKAKQSAFVALDVRKKRFGSFDKRQHETDCVSILVLTEYSHWELKSRNMIVSCIDINLSVDDEIIIQAFQAFEEAFGPTFYAQITKDAYLTNQLVRNVADRIVNEFDGRIFRDLDDNLLKAIIYNNGHLIVAN